MQAMGFGPSLVAWKLVIQSDVCVRDAGWHHQERELNSFLERVR